MGSRSCIKEPILNMSRSYKGNLWWFTTQWSKRRAVGFGIGAFFGPSSFLPLGRRRQMSREVAGKINCSCDSQNTTGATATKSRDFTFYRYVGEKHNLPASLLINAFFFGEMRQNYFHIVIHVVGSASPKYFVKCGKKIIFSSSSITPLPLSSQLSFCSSLLTLNIHWPPAVLKRQNK